MYVSEISAINVPFTFYCACGTSEEIALVDSRAMENFMDNQMVERLGIRKWEMTMPHRVFNVDGSKNKQGILTHYHLLRVKKGKEEDLQQFYITSLGGDRAILGYPWLHRFSPTIDWKGGKVLGAPITIETSLLKWAREKEINRIICRACACVDWEGDTIIAQISPLPTHAAQQWAIAANKNKQTTNELPQRYSRHASIFSEVSANRFPPSQPDDMAVTIRLISYFLAC